MAPAYVFFASMLPLAVVSSAYLAPAVVRTPPPRAVVRMQKIEQNTAHVAQSEGAFAEAGSGKRGHELINARSYFPSDRTRHWLAPAALSPPWR